MKTLHVAAPYRDKEHALLLGAINHEAVANPISTRFPNHRAEYRLNPGGPDEVIPYGGSRELEWGGKAPAATDLTTFRRRRDFRQQLGGGLHNTAAQLADLRRFAKLIAIDTAEPDLEVCGELIRKGIDHSPLALHPMKTNVVLTRSGAEPSRVCLTAPTAKLGNADGVEFDFTGGSGIALINSCKSVETVRRFSDAALIAGFPQYSVINGALPLAERVALLLARDTASVCNLEEFSALSTELGGVADDERTANLEWVALAVADFAVKQETGDLAITLGSRGTLIADRGTGLIAHVALAARYREKVNSVLRCRPDLVLGSGDRWFAGFVASHSAFRGNPCTQSRAVASALDASASVVNSYSPRLQATTKWFTVRMFERRYVA